MSEEYDYFKDLDLSNFEKKSIDKFKKYKKSLSNPSIKNYIKNVRRLNNNHKINSLAFLSDIQEIMDRLNKFKYSTKKTYLFSIIAFLEIYNRQTKYLKLHDKYFDIVNELISNYEENHNSNEKTDKEEKNWIDWNNVIELRNKYKDKVDKFKKEKELTNIEWNILLKYIVLCLYSYNPPRRIKDYQHMIVNKTGAKKVDDFNIYDTKNSKFIFNNFKTVNHTDDEDKIIKVEDELKSILKLYLKYHPKKNENDFYLLVKNDGSKLNQSNGLTLLLNSIFKPKKVSASMLRKSYWSEKIDAKEIEKDVQNAKKAGHSISTVIKKYVKE